MPVRSFPLRYRLTRLAIRTVGRLSDGIRLALDEGLTAGRTLDYVYRNQASGRWLIGRFIDRGYLAAPGWEAIRERRRTLEAYLAEAIDRLRAARQPVALLDVASGPAGYVLAVLAAKGDTDVTALCRDLEPKALADGRAAAAGLGLTHVTFAPGDALDRAGLLALRPAPSVAVASGFYDWIVADDVVRESMAILGEALAPGGYFVLTVQSGHFNLALMEAVFTDFNQEPLRMTVRSADLVTDWLSHIGLTVIRLSTDRYGYYTVVLAQKGGTQPTTA